MLARIQSSDGIGVMSLVWSADVYCVDVRVVGEFFNRCVYSCSCYLRMAFYECFSSLLSP